MACCLMTPSWTNFDSSPKVWCSLRAISQVLMNLFHNMASEMKLFKLLPHLPGANELTHWGRDKMDTISQTTFSSALSWMKMLEFRLKFHWNMFLRVQLTIFQHWFRQWLGAGQATSHYLNQWWLIYQRIYASLGLNELMCTLVPQTHQMKDMVRLIIVYCDDWRNLRLYYTTVS